MVDPSESETNDHRQAWLASLRDPVPRALDKEFAALLERACEEFEILTLLLKGDIEVVPSGEKDRTDEPVSADAQVRRRRKSERRAPSRVRKALALAFLFDVNRAYRICEHGAAHLKLPREERKLFLRGLRPVVAVRDVNEHRTDPASTKDSRPSMHIHEFGNMHLALTEIGMITIGHEKIFIGPINLVDVYRLVHRMRGLAGYAALRKRAHPEPQPPAA